MMDLVQSEHIQAWKDYVQSKQTQANRKTLFTACGPVVVELIKRGLTKPGERVAAFKAAEGLSAEEKKELFPELLAMASWEHALQDKAKEMIRALPKAWVVANVEEAAEPILVKGEQEEFENFLALYDELDKSLAIKLARRAVQHDDDDVREAGRSYLVKNS